MGSYRRAPWTPERVDMLKKLWTEDGLSATQIEQRMGGTSRNAVLGKLLRLGLLGKSTSRRTHTRRSTKQNRAASPSPKTPPAAPRQSPPGPQPDVDAGQPFFEPDEEPRIEFEELVIPENERQSILSIRNGMCRWPIGDPGEPDFHLCGKPSEGVYCTFHSSIAFAGKPQRKQSEESNLKRRYAMRRHHARERADQTDRVTE